MPNKKNLPPIDEHLQSIPFFTTLDASVVQQLVKISSQKAYHKGDLLFCRDDVASHIYLVVDGWVKLFRETLDGDEAVIDVVNKGQLIGETCLFSETNYPFDAEIIEDATLIVLPTDKLRQLANENHAFSLALLNLLAQNQTRHEHEIEHRNLQNAPQRIGCFLLRLCKQGQTAPITLRLPYDKQLIASRLGMKAETFSRALAKLRKEVNLTVEGSNVTINDLDGLVSHVCAACSSCFPCQDLSKQ